MGMLKKLLFSLGVNTIADSGSFAVLQSISIGVWSEKLSGDGRSLVPSNPIGNSDFWSFPQLNKRIPLMMSLTSSNSDQNRSEFSRKNFRQRSEPSTFEYDWRTPIFDQSANSTSLLFLIYHMACMTHEKGLIYTNFLCIVGNYPRDLII